MCCCQQYHLVQLPPPTHTPGLGLDVGPTGGPFFFMHLLLEMSCKDVLGLLLPKAALQTGRFRQERRKFSVDRNVFQLRPRFVFFHNLSPRRALHKDPGLIITRKKLHRILKRRLWMQTRPPASVMKANRRERGRPRIRSFCRRRTRGGAEWWRNWKPELMHPRHIPGLLRYGKENIIINLPYNPRPRLGHTHLRALK